MNTRVYLLLMLSLSFFFVPQLHSSMHVKLRNQVPIFGNGWLCHPQHVGILE